MKQAKNGTYWTNKFWSEKQVISAEEYSETDNWFYDNLFFEDQYKLNLSKFSKEIILFNKNLKGDRLIDMLLYSEEKNFTIQPEKLDKIIAQALTENKLSLQAYWFTAYQSTTYKHDVGTIGVYTFEQGNGEHINGELYPVFSKLNEGVGQELQHNYGLFSGLVGKNKDWILLISILNEGNKALSVKIGGNEGFCRSIEEKLV